MHGGTPHAVYTGWPTVYLVPRLQALHKKSRRPSSLCNLCVLCVSVVDEFRAKTHHRDTENTEKSMCRDFLCKANRTSGVRPERGVGVSKKRYRIVAIARLRGRSHYAERSRRGY